MAGLLDHEDGAAARLVALFRRAREVIREHLRALPASGAALFARQLGASVGDAIGRLRFGAQESLDRDVQEAVRLGVEGAGVPGGLGLPAGIRDQLAFYHADLITDVTDALRADITEAVRLGLLAGRTPDEIAADVLGTGIEPIGPFATAEARAQAIAITECARVANMASYATGRAAAERTPGLKKVWKTAADERVRPSHARLNGTEKAPDEPFLVGGHAAQYPHDPALPAGETVRCRCRLTWQGGD